MQTTQSHLNLQEEEYQGLLDKMISIRNRYSKVILLLTEFIESFVEKDPSILQRQNDIFLDIFSNTYSKILEALNKKQKKILNMQMQKARHEVQNRVLRHQNTFLPHMASHNAQASTTSSVFMTDQNALRGKGKRVADRSAIGSSILSASSNEDRDSIARRNG